MRTTAGSVQRLQVDAQTGSLAFDLGEGPVLGLGEGGPQFDRRGAVDRMRSGQGGYRLRTHGGRVPIPWLIGTSGWAMFIHRPYGSVDLTGGEGKFIPPRLAVRTANGCASWCTNREHILRAFRERHGPVFMPRSFVGIWRSGCESVGRTSLSRLD